MTLRWGQDWTLKLWPLRGPGSVKTSTLSVSVSTFGNTSSLWKLLTCQCLFQHLETPAVTSGLAWNVGHLGEVQHILGMKKPKPHTLCLRNTQWDTHKNNLYSKTTSPVCVWETHNEISIKTKNKREREGKYNKVQACPSMFCTGNFLLWIFTLEGFVKACPVSLTSMFLQTSVPWTQTQTSMFLQTSVPWTQTQTNEVVLKYKVKPTRQALTKPSRVKIWSKKFPIQNMLGLCCIFSTWHHTQSLLQGAVPRSHRELCLSLSLSIYIF